MPATTATIETSIPSLRSITRGSITRDDPWMQARVAQLEEARKATEAAQKTPEVTAPVITPTESPIPFLGTHNATITIVSPKTGDHRTFKIATVKSGSLVGKRIISLLVGTNNETDYQGFGFVYEDGTIHVWSKYKGTQYEKYGDIFDRPIYWRNRGIQFMPEGRCRRCNRKLTHPESVTTGIGPECAEKEV